MGCEGKILVLTLVNRQGILSSCLSADKECCPRAGFSQVLRASIGASIGASKILVRDKKRASFFVRGLGAGKEKFAVLG